MRTHRLAIVLKYNKVLQNDFDSALNLFFPGITDHFNFACILTANHTQYFTAYAPNRWQQLFGR
jgi:hypothetical protein